MIKRIFLISLSLFAMSCSDSSLQSENPKLVPYVAPKESEKITDVGEITKESFRPALDILFVIDNSGSMSPHQQRLAANVNLFTAAIVQNKFLDYHIGVVNSTGQSGFKTELCCGELSGNPAYVDRNTPNGIQLLARNMIVGTTSGTNEMFFGPIMWALDPIKPPSRNIGFLRQEAYLAVIIITDSDDQTPGADAQMTYDFLKQIKGSSDKVFIGGVFVPDAELQSCGQGGESDVIPVTDELPRFFQLSSAQTFSLCDPDYGSKLAEIGKLIANKAQTLNLKKLPKAGSLSVTIAGTPIPNDHKKGWTYNPALNSLEFGREIDWSVYPDNTYPVVNFESLPVSAD